MPSNLAEAQHLAPGLTPIYAEPAELAVDVETPAGEVLAIDSPALRDRLRAASTAAEELTLLRSDRALTDCRPVSLISAQTVAALGGEVGEELDQRRFRANIHAVFGSAFAEDTFVGKSLKIGAKAVISVLERDPRCKMITLDPDTGQESPEVLKAVAQSHQGRVGVYGAVLVEGTILPGDQISLLN